ncbi:MAG: hypothetical protein IJD60_11030 [Clostridia bacterium]|nr:hypothetical protein [Clostridia bacterium]
MAANRMTKKWLKNHFAYSWWKYMLVICVSILGVNVLFTTTAYRPPEEKKIEIYVLNGFVTAQAMQDELLPLFQEACPDQESFFVANINLSGNDAYAYMQFSTYIAAQQGDVCLMPESEVHKLSAEGAEHAFVDLTEYVSGGVIDTKDIDLSGGMLRTESGEKRLFAIPADSLYGLLNHGNDPADSYLVMLAHGGNDANAARTVNLLIEQYHQEKPEGYDELHNAQKQQATYF